MAYAGARVSKMAKRCFRVTTPAESATSLRNLEAREGDAGYLAVIAYRHMGLYGAPPVSGRIFNFKSHVHHAKGIN